MMDIWSFKIYRSPWGPWATLNLRATFKMCAPLMDYRSAYEEGDPPTIQLKVGRAMEWRGEGGGGATRGCHGDDSTQNGGGKRRPAAKVHRQIEKLRSFWPRFAHEETTISALALRRVQVALSLVFKVDQSISISMESSRRALCVWFHRWDFPY